jgi:peptide/nickel transport system permease protein
MTTYIIRRCIRAFIILLVITMIIFFAMRLLPGDPIYMIINQGQMTNTSQEMIESIRHKYGLDQPLPLQYVNWLAGIVHGDFGTSITYGSSPLDIVARTMPVTFNLALPAFILGLIAGIPAGIICAIRRGTWIDTAVTILANIGITIPIFWLGTILIYLFALKFNWLPVQGYTPLFEDIGKNVSQLVMPIFCLAIFSMSAVARQTRSTMLEVLRQDYIRTAWSKGLRERSMVMKHALKNSLIPVVILSGLFFANILGGEVLIETVFNIRGAGLAIIRAVFGRDYPVVQAFIFILSIFVLFINVLVDISLGWLDPRIRYG